MPTLRIGDDQRRARIAWRHRLAPDARIDDPLAIATSLVVLHATDPATVHLSLATRMARPDIAASERALYDDRSLVRMLGMRRTLFAVPRELVPVVQASTTDDIAAREHRRLLQFLEANDIANAERWLSDLKAATAAALSARGGAFTAELTDDVAGLDREIVVGSGRWQTTVRLSSRIMFLLGADGHAVRGRPRGTWLSSQHRWVPTERWFGEPVAEVPADAARSDLARRWLEAFGPAGFDDLKWWTGWTVARTRRALAALDTVEVTLDTGATGIVLADDVEPVPQPAPWAVLLPALDATPMGWTGRDWFLGPHRPQVFDRNGNVGPTVWCDGRIVGGWAQRPDGTVVYELLTDIGHERAAMVAAEAARLDACLGGVRLTPRFRTPLERRLSA